MSTYNNLYTAYLANLYKGITVLALGAAVLVVGWLLVNHFYGHSRFYQLISWLYVAWSAMIYTVLLVYPWMVK